MICPACKTPVEYTSNITKPGKMPRPDVSWLVCADCGSISKFIMEDGELSVRAATADDLADVKPGERAITVALRRFALKAVKHGVRK